MSAAPVQDQTETEWQFDTPDIDAAAQWVASANIPGYRIQPGSEKRLRDTYLDTEDWRLNRAKYTARVRAKGDGYELTIKGAASATNGLRQRREITERLPSSEDGPVAMSAAAPGQCGELLRLVGGLHPIRELFTIATHRRTFMLEDSQGELAEIAVDGTTIEGYSGELRRVEVEVVAGGLERAQRFVDVFKVGARLEPATVSKFEFALEQAELLVPRPLLPNTVAPGMTAAEAAYAIFRKQLNVILTNEGSTRLGEDIEGLHDMRVATRRTRAAMSAFSRYLPAMFERYRMHYGWVAAALGEVRDLDVQLERMDEWRSEFDPELMAALAPFEAIQRERRDAARRRMLRALDSRRYDILMARFARTLQGSPPRSFAPGREPIESAAPDIVRRRYRQFRRLGDAITPASPPADYHMLRIAGKKLRYALEFVAPIYGPQLLEFSSKVTALQDILGLHQDADVAVEELAALARQETRRLGPDAIMAMGAVSERYRQHAHELRGQLPAAYKQLTGKRWKQLVKLMDSKKP